MAANEITVKLEVKGIATQAALAVVDGLRRMIVGRDLSQEELVSVLDELEHQLRSEG